MGLQSVAGTGTDKEEVKETIEKAKKPADVTPSEDEPKNATTLDQENEEFLSGEGKEGEEAKEDVKEAGDDVEEKGDGGSEEGDGGSEEESDDPDRLWCICQQPHGDRFMICCDQCEDWYHGNCVDITVAQGKRMEKEGKEYVCPLCIEKAKKLKAEREANRTARQVRREDNKDQELKKKLLEHLEVPLSPTVKATPTKETKPHHKRTTSTSSATHHTPTSDKDQYGLSQLFLPDNARPPPSPPLQTTPTSSEAGEKHKVKEEPLPTTPCVVPGCPRTATPPSIYCGEACIEQHTTEMLKYLSERGITTATSASEFVRGSGGVAVTERATGKTLVGIAAPSEKNLAGWLKAHPSYQVLIPSGKAPTRLPKARRIKDETKKEPESPVKQKFPVLMDAPTVRSNAKKALYQILWLRREGASDLDIDQEQVEKIAHEIEEKLYNLHQQITTKYKNKYRSLVFNLKDTKNQGLFRKVLRREVTPRELVRMSSEKLASEELSHWREETIKKDLEKIKEAEEEAKALGGVIRKKTYKGDIEIEVDDSAVETVVPVEAMAGQVEEKDASSQPPTAAPTTPAKSHSHSKEHKSHSKNSKSHSHSTSDTKPHFNSHSKEPKSHSHSSKAADSTGTKAGGGGGGGGEGILGLLTDTTSQHGTHVFDHHCDVCLGKVPPAQVQVSSTEGSHPSPDSRTEDTEVDESQQTLPDLAPPPSFATEKIWQGTLNMEGLARFRTAAYSVTSKTEYLDKILPATLHVKGRIANVQVWDYLDKLRSSMTRDIVVLRFDPLPEDHDSYLTLLNYLLRKHRCGVIDGTYHGIKDFYVVPHLAYDDLSRRIPVDGPGLPSDHPDVLLGVIVRSKHHEPPPVFYPEAVPTTTTDELEPSSEPVTVGQKRPHRSGSGEHGRVGGQTKRLRIGVGYRTPPIAEEEITAEPESSSIRTDKFDGDSSRDAAPGLNSGMARRKRDLREGVNSDAEGEVAMEIDPQGEEAAGGEGTQNVQLSFYGQHQPLTQSPQPVDSSAPGIPVSAAPTLMPGFPVSSNIQTILSQFSEKKLKEIASAMSSLTQATPPSLVSSSSSAAVTGLAGLTGSSLHSPVAPTNVEELPRGLLSPTDQGPPIPAPSPSSQPVKQPPSFVGREQHHPSLVEPPSFPHQRLLPRAQQQQPPPQHSFPRHTQQPSHRPPLDPIAPTGSSAPPSHVHVSPPHHPPPLAVHDYQGQREGDMRERGRGGWQPAATEQQQQPYHPQNHPGRPQVAYGNVNHSSYHSQLPPSHHPQAAPGPHPQAGPLGPHPQGGPPGPHPQAGPPGSHPQGRPPGPHPQAGPLGPHPQGGPPGPHPQGRPPGPHPQAGPLGPSYPQGGPPGPHPQGRPPGPHPQAGPLGPHTQGGPPGPHPQSGSLGPHPQGRPSGPHPQAGPLGPHPQGGPLRSQPHPSEYNHSHGGQPHPPSSWRERGPHPHDQQQQQQQQHHGGYYDNQEDYYDNRPGRLDDRIKSHDYGHRPVPPREWQYGYHGDNFRDPRRR